MNKCITCNKETKNQKFCSHTCNANLRNSKNYEKYINDWKLGIVDGGRGTMNGYGAVSHHVRRYLMKKFDYKCSQCSWSETNIFTKSIPLEIDHIDGNSMNHKEENLTLLCPNCHSLTRGHSTSKGDGRRYYRQKYHKEKVG